MLRLGVPARELDGATERLVRPLRDRPIEDMSDLLRRLARLELLGAEVTVYPDAEEFVQDRLLRERIRRLVTEETLEENLLGTLSSKQGLAMAVLDPDSDVEAVDMLSSTEDLRNRLEVLLGARPEAGADEQECTARLQELEVQRERIATAGGALVGAAFSFLGELLPATEATPSSNYLADLFRKQLGECLEEDESGRPVLTVKLPDRSALDALADSLGQLLAAHRPQP